MTKETARTLLVQIFNTYSNIITVNYKDGVIKEAFEMAIEALRKTENSSEIPNNCDTCRNKGFEGCKQPCLGCQGCDKYEPKDEPTEITYQNCSDALLKMWMDNVLTDAEYNRIMDKLNNAQRKDELQTGCAWK